MDMAVQALKGKTGKMKRLSQVKRKTKFISMHELKMQKHF